MDVTHLTMSVNDTKLIDNPQIVKNKPKKRSLIERELETSLSERVTSPLTNIEGSSTSRYGRARRAKADLDFYDTDKAVAKVLKTPVTDKSLPKVQSPVYKMHASNSPVKLETPKRVLPLESNIQNQIDKIHHENISLSRFGFNENKQSPTKTCGKVYIRKDLTQRKEKEDSGVIKNFSSKKSTQKSNSHIDNILERSSEKYCLSVSTSKKRPPKEYLDTSSVVKTLDFDSVKKKTKDGKVRPKVLLSKSEIFDIEAKCEYQVGDLGWARVGTYPFWPCIVTREPYTDLFVRKKMFGRVEHDIVHVTFFGDNGRRGWIVDNMLRKYQGILEFQRAKEAFTPEAKKKDPRLYSAFFVSEKKLALWNCSVQEAETLLKEPKRLRIDLFNDMLEKSRVKPLKRPSSKMTRTNSDVSLSESLLGTLFSEDDQKSDDLDRSKSRSRKKSFDVSEVVTACLDNMAAKTGMTKIQKQSHMDRWLQKAKSKTPEKSQPKISIKTESKGVAYKKKVVTVKKSQMTFLNKTKRILPANLMSFHNEHDYSSVEISGTEPVTESTELIEISRNGIGYITKVETLAGKDYDFSNEDYNSLHDDYIIEQVDMARDVVIANTCSTPDAVLCDQPRDYNLTAETLEELRVPKSAPTNTNLNYVDGNETENGNKRKLSRNNQYAKNTLNNQAVNSVLEKNLQPLLSECVKTDKTVSSKEGATTAKGDNRIMGTSPVVSCKREVSTSDKCMMETSMDRLKDIKPTVTTLKGTSQPIYVAECTNHNHENEFSCTIDITVTELNDEPTDQLAEPTKVNTKPTEHNDERLKLNVELTKLTAEPIDLNTEPTELNSEPTNVNVEPAKPYSELNAEPANVNTVLTERNAETKKISADSTELNGEPTELSAENTDVVAECTNLNAHATEVNSGRTEVNAKLNEIIIVESNELNSVISKENSEPIKLYSGPEEAKLYSGPEEAPHNSSRDEKEKSCTGNEIQILDKNASQQDESKFNDVAIEIDDIEGDAIVSDVKGTKDLIFNNYESKVCSKDISNIYTKNMELSIKDNQDAHIDGSLANLIDNVNVKEHDKIGSKIACENSDDFSNCNGYYSENDTQILAKKENISEYKNKHKDIIYNVPVDDKSTNSIAKVLVLLDNKNIKNEKQMIPNECKESCILQNTLQEETKLEDAPSSLVVECFDKKEQIIEKDIFFNNDIQNAHSETDVPNIDQKANLNKAIKDKITEIDDHDNSKTAQTIQKFVDNGTANQFKEVEPIEIHFDVTQKQHILKTLELKGCEISTKHLDERKTRSKKSKRGYENVNKSLKDPNFLHYLELRQDMLLDDNPGLTQEEVVNYLYKTWLYEVSSKLERVKPEKMSLKSLSDKSSNQKSAKRQKIVALTNDPENLEMAHRNNKIDVEVLIPNEITVEKDIANGYHEPTTQKCLDDIKHFECNSESILIDPEESKFKKRTTRSETNKSQGYVTKNKAVENTYFQHHNHSDNCEPRNESIIQKEHENRMDVPINDQESFATEHGNKKKDTQIQKETEKTVENDSSNSHNEPITENCVDNIKREEFKPESMLIDLAESGLKNGKTRWKTNNRRCFVIINKALENTTDPDFQDFKNNANYFEPSKATIVKKEFLNNGPSLTNNKKTHMTDLHLKSEVSEEIELLVKSKTSNGRHEPKQNEKCNDDIKQVECDPAIVPIGLENSVLEKRKTRSKTNSNQGSVTMNKALENPDFQTYLELRQDTVIEEYPHFTREEIVNYLYKTWLYVDSTRFEADKAEDTFVKDLNKMTEQKRKSDIKSEVCDFNLSDATNLKKENEMIILQNNKLNDQESSKINHQDQSNGVRVTVEINLPVGDSLPIKHHEAKPNEKNIDRQIKSYSKTTSINSQNSDTHQNTQKLRTRSKTNSRQHCVTLRKALNNSDFQRYLEFRQNKLITENPHLTKKEIINYLYKTWFQDVNSKPEANNTGQTLITDFAHKLAKKSKKDFKSEVIDFESTEIDEIDSTKCLDQFQNQGKTTTTDLQKENKCVKVEVDINEIPAETNMPKESKPETKSLLINQKDFDSETASINSEDSETCLEKLKSRTKTNNRQRSKTKGLDDPEFQHYLELRQDTLIDENPQLTQEEIMHYLHKTWLYEESFKPEAIKTEQLLVKGLKQESVLSPKKVKKKNVEKQLVVKLEEIMLKEKPHRKLAKPLYNYDYSDIEEELEIFEILNASKDQIKIKGKASSDLSQNFKSIQKKEEDKEKDEYLEIAEIYNDESDIEEQYFEYLTIPKPNLFKGLVREKICNICEKKSNLVKCKGCNDMFHVECVNKPIEVTEAPTAIKGRKKKMKPKNRRSKGLNDSNSLDSESQSDDKSQEINVSGDLNMSIEEIESEPILTVDLDVFESHSTTKMQDLLGGNDVNYFNNYFEINWDGTVPGKCEIVDVKPKIKLEVDPEFTNFRCHNCQKYEVPVCFVCKSAESPKGKVEYRQKCQQQHCNKFYHLECLDHWPQTQLNSLEPVKDHKFESFTCARHVCHTCVCDDPRGCKTRFCSDKLARCVRCPATYHCFTKCLPAGSQILTGSHIVCPRHYEHRPGKVPCHVNTGWCFICALGGTLICCEYCPTSFHAECLNIKPPEGNYMCEDCETGRLPLYGEMVWVKLGHYRWWPGLILHPSEIPENIMAVKHSPGEFVVRFFGQYDYYWVNRGRVFPFQEGDSGRISTHKSKIDEAFIKAMAHAQRACEILKNVEPNEEESQELAQSLLPPQYVKLKCNKPCGSLVGWRTDDEHSLTQCECDPREEDVCGPYTNCLNRMLLTECGPTCRAGDKCNNRQFEKRQYPKLVPYRTPHRGWGLKTLEDIRQGQFVIEYVGELIDLEEFERRMRWMHEIRDENFYFLTLDKDRMIDAGPKGNLARFMNHCCEPNCETQKWTVLGDVRVGLFAMKDIPANSELTFNYNLVSAGIEKKQCLCGASRCSGYIGAKPKLDEAQLKKKKSYKKRKQPDESPSTSKSKPKPRKTSRSKPKELTEIEKDLLIIKSAVNGIPSDSECDRSLDTERKTLKRKKTDTTEENMFSGVLKKVKIELTECVK